MYHELIELGIVYLCGIMMPGPSTTLIMRNSILYSRYASLECSLGIVLGIALQTGIVLTGTIFIDIESSVFTLMRVVSSLFLIYLGVTSIFSRNKNDKLIIQDKKTNVNYKSSRFLEGLLLEITNPIALTFFITILTTIVNTNVDVSIKFLYWFEIIIFGTFWFFSFSLLTSSKQFVNFFGRFGKFVAVASGCLFFVIGCSILVSIISAYLG